MEGRDRRKEERRRDRRTKVKFENVRTYDAVSAPSSAGRVCRRTHSRPRGRSRTGGNCGGRVRDSQSIPLSSPRLHPPRPTHSLRNLPQSQHHHPPIPLPHSRPSLHLHPFTPPPPIAQVPPARHAQTGRTWAPQTSLPLARISRRPRMQPLRP